MTPHQKNLETVRSACIAANPSIMELGFGCELVQDGIHFITVGTTTDGNPVTIKKEGVSDSSKPHGANLEIFEGKTLTLGRPIRLADVLIALDKLRLPLVVTVAGEIYSAGQLCNSVLRAEVSWNLLNDDLTAQSPETVAFLASLLTS